MASRPASNLYLGTISGTSVDALDLALLEVGEPIRLRAAAEVPFPATLRASLLNLGQPGHDDVDTLGGADHALGVFIATSINAFLAREGLSAERVRAIGSHGQTVRHRPDAEQPFTLQIGDPNLIAERTGITTVADFRRRDMAAGGQGAPLVPRFHEALFRSAGETRAVLNIGGISNLSLLPADQGRPVLGFDCGPGNALLDSWCAEHRSEAFDANGAWAATGQVLPGLLDSLLEDDYLARPPPKSTGREHFNLSWLRPKLRFNMAAADVQRTLLEMTAVSVQRAVDEWGGNVARVVVCGGGRRNGLLMQRLVDLLPTPVEPTETLGFDGDAMEAAAFGWLAHQRLQHRPGSASSVTGATGDRILGAVYPGEGE